MILDALCAHNKKEQASFHMPGHKRGVGFCGTPLESPIFQLDATELPGTDALIAPKADILAAERRAALVYGAKHSFYLVNGSTCGILAMFYASFMPGEEVLIDRNCHQSVIHGAAIAGVRPIFMKPSTSVIPGIPGAVEADTVAKLLAEHPKAKGVFLTSPNYYGAVADISAIAEIVHRAGALLLVDEAHGAHFPFSESFPASCISQGADLAVTSMHKSMPAPNQTALLHMGDAFETEKVRQAVFVFQTSSPSYIFLAAMEQTVEFGVKQGERETKRVLSALQGLGVTLDDPLKRILCYGDKGYSGYEIEAILREKFGIYAELCDRNTVLLMASWANREQDFALLQKAVCYLDNMPAKSPLPVIGFETGEAESVLTPYEIRSRKTELVSFAQSESRICAVTVTAFPPCVPIILPGERITKQHIILLLELTEQGATVTGMEQGRLAVVV